MPPDSDAGQPFADVTTILQRYHEGEYLCPPLRLAPLYLPDNEPYPRIPTAKNPTSRLQH